MIVDTCRPRRDDTFYCLIMAIRRFFNIYCKAGKGRDNIFCSFFVKKCHFKQQLVNLNFNYTDMIDIYVIFNLTTENLTSLAIKLNRK